MPRKGPSKGIHTGPDKGGKKAFEEKGIEKGNYDDPQMKHLVEILKTKTLRTNDYKGRWTEEEFRDAIIGYFDFISEREIKPSKASLQLWLGCSRSQYYDWETDKTGRFEYKTDLVNIANRLIEASYVGRVEKYPTGNIFLLKTTQGYVEKSSVDVTTNGQTINSADEVKDLVGKLNLDKTK